MSLGSRKASDKGFRSHTQREFDGAEGCLLGIYIVASNDEGITL